MKKVSSFLAVWLILSQVAAQKHFDITLISDAGEQENHFFEEAIKAEISALLASQYELSFTEIYTGGDMVRITEEIASVYGEKETDVLIGAGIVSSKILANQGYFPLPSIASIQLLNPSDSTTLSSSGISNFTYINSPFNIVAEVEALQEICACKKLAVLTDLNLSSIEWDREKLFSSIPAEIEWVSLAPELPNSLSDLSSEVEGVYVLSSLASYLPDSQKDFFNQLNERKLPVFTLLDAPVHQFGAYASFTTADNLQKIPRRIALNTEKIAEGKNPQDFPIDRESFTKQLVVNMETANKIGLYPNWTLLDNALLVHINKPYTSRVLNLRSAIAEGIQQNLGYQIESKQSQISSKDIDLARSNYLPQLNLESNGFFLDENTVNASFGTLGRFNWTAGASFSQLILAEPALANISIQKLLFESQQQVQKESELDVILEVAQRYFNYLQALALADLQNDNIQGINQNLTIATDKEKVGYSGSNDVYRWETELELAKTDLYAANAQLKSVRFQLNEALNRPIQEEFSIESSENISQFIDELDELLVNLIQDQKSLNQLANFMVQEAFQNLPEIQQIQLAINAQERLLKSNKRAFYLPTLAFGANYEYPIETLNPGESPPIPDFNVAINPSWNAVFNLSIPFFAGGSRKYQKQQTSLGLYQLRDQQREVKNLLELQVRANVEQVNASYNTIRLTRSAAESAQKNILIVRDLYKSGQVDVITLVDAQNALLGAQINATNAAYQFMIDYFSLQRSIGDYPFLGTETQRTDFLRRFLTYKTN